MSLNRSAVRARPAFMRVQQSLRPITRGLPKKVPAMAILIPLRHASTETSTSSLSGNQVPPGFNIDQARKNTSPVPNQSQSEKNTSSISNSEAVQELKDNVFPIPADKPTTHPPTSATETSTLMELSAEKAATEGKGDKAEDRKIAKKEEERKKLTLWQKVKKEAAHYWDGTKLLAAEVKISSKLALKMAAGYELSRRENRQLQRTTQDLGRLVPFSVFVIVPFAELLLPVALKLFPNLLPSTYEGAKAKEAKATSLRSKRKEVSTFLRQSLKESGLPVAAANAQREEFVEFFRKVRTTGESPTQAEIIKVCKIFKDDLTLDNCSRPQLVGICKYMNLNTLGPDGVLRYTIRHRMRQIKRDDKAIAFEGVDSLSVLELQSACASRGLRTHGVSPGRLRDDLQLWLDLRLKYGVPSTLLVLSNAFLYASGKETELTTQLDALQAVLSSVPEELFHEIELEVHNAEGAATNKQRLEVLKEQQELIEEENEQKEASAGRPVPKDDENIDDKEDGKDAAKDGEVAKEAEGEADKVEKKA